MSATRPLSPPGAELDEAERLKAVPEGTPAGSGGTRPQRKRLLLSGLLLLAVGAMVVWGGDWVRGRFLYVHETDARVVADMVAVAARVEGWLVEVAVDEGDEVRAGQRLAHVDSRTAELRLAELRAELDGLAAEAQRTQARRAMVDQQTSSRLLSSESRLSATRALAQSLGHELNLARSEYERAQKLSSTGVVSANSLDRSRTVYQRARQALLSARADVAAAQAQLAETGADRQELMVLDADAQVLQKRLAQYSARVERQRLVVDEHDVLSPGTGVISRVFVEAGEYVRLGQRVALMHDRSQIRVEANIRETEIGRVRVGQPVEVVVDAYPDMQLRGTVERIGQATTGEFALLPTPNPSGNFTKVTQRLPVRIALEQRDQRLRPGMLVEIYIDVSER